MSKLSPQEKALFDFYKEVARILWEEWDPIGINDGESECSDEYDRYVPGVTRSAIEDEDATKIAGYLSTFAEQDMGLGLAHDHDLKVAKLIIKTKQEMLG